MANDKLPDGWTEWDWSRRKAALALFPAHRDEEERELVARPTLWDGVDPNEE